MSDSGSNSLPESQPAASSEAQSSGEELSNGGGLTALEEQVLSAMHSSDPMPVAVADHPALNKGLGPFKVGESKTAESGDHGSNSQQSAIAGQS